MQALFTLAACLSLTLCLTGCPKEKGPAEPASDRAKEVHGQETSDEAPADAADATKAGK